MLQSPNLWVKPHTLRLPPQPTPFIGRVEEVAEITDLLADPSCRLLTLMGPGGIGKTRLAIQVARESQAAFADGVCLVSLQPVHSADFLASTIADALDFPWRGYEELTLQLVDYLRPKKLLLLLDNFEQLLSQGGTNLLTTILESCPSVKLLVTSQEVLNLQEEWLYSVYGLPFPSISQPLVPEEEELIERPYSAIQLFVDRALRVRRDFSLEDEYAEVVRICQRVEGIPLALELAASWVKTLHCEVIAAEIQRNLDFLTTTLRNIPSRQQSMRAIFDYSWQLLNEDERNVFKRLSVFRGGFRRKAAERVANASLPILSSLVDKSLLRWEADGRYQVHELLRQYAAAQLVLSPEDVARVYDLHCVYYTHFLHERAKDVIGRRQREIIQEIAAELENIRAAWNWAVTQARFADIQKAIYTFYQFCDFQSRYQEGVDTCEKAIASLEKIDGHEQQELLADLYTSLGWHYIRLGRLEEAQTVFGKGQAIFDDLGILPPPGFGTDPLNGLGLLANILGNYTEAMTLAERARQRNESQGDKLNLQITYYVLSNAAFALGSYEVAREYAQHAYNSTKETHNRWFMAYMLSKLGDVDRALGDYEQARQQYQTSYGIKQELNDPEGMAVALSHLGRIAWLQQDYQAAERLYRQSLAIYQTINDRGGLATSLCGLGLTACATAHYEQARQYLGQALQITHDIQFVPLTLVILIGIGELLRQIGQPERGNQILSLVLHHPASDRETQDWAGQYLQSHSSPVLPNLSPDSLNSTVAALLTELAQPLEFEPANEPETFQTVATQQELSSAPLPPGSPALIEPLTPRELEVLRLIATGMTNQQIADALIISVGTAKFYTSQIYSKLSVSSRTQAIARARELDLLA